LYAAYGSNLMLDQIVQRCPDVHMAAAGRILDYRLIFARVASIEAHEGSTTLVGLYNLSASDITTLDKREGLGRTYDRYLITPITNDGRAIRCFTYIKRHNLLEPPSEDYYQRLSAGFRDWRFDDRRLRHARDAAVKAWQDPNHRREVEKHRRQSTAVWGVLDAKPQSKTMRAIQKAVMRPADERLKSSDDDVFDRIEREAKRRVATTCPGTGKLIIVPRYATAAHHNVEWGKRSDTLYWRIKGDRTWYRDISGHDDIQSGLVRGEFESTLPGAQAFKVIDNQKGKRA
jgi:hypothetical protein